MCVCIYVRMYVLMGLLSTVFFSRSCTHILSNSDFLMALVNSRNREEMGKFTNEWHKSVHRIKGNEDEFSIEFLKLARLRQVDESTI